MITFKRALPLILLLAACGKPKDDGKTVVRFLAAPDVGGFSKEIIKNFEAQNPSIRVEMVEGPAGGDPRENMYATSFMAQEDTYDLVYLDVAWLPKFASQGWLKPLDELFPAEKQKEFLPGDLMGSRFEGKIYRVPVQSDGGMLYYRKDLVSPAPKTWAELVAAAKKAQKPPELWGFVFQGKQYEGLVCDFLELVWGFGGDLLDEKGGVVIDKPQAVAALTAWVDAIHKDKISPEGVLTYQEEEARHAFQEGKAVFMRNWPYAWNLLQEEKSPVRGKVGIIPMVHGPSGKSAATLGGWGFALSSFTKHPAEAWKFVEFAASAESQKLAYMKGGILPTRKALFSDADVIAKSPHMKELGGVLANARPRPMHPKWARMSDILQLHVSKALSKQEEPQAALSAAAKEISDQLK
jgi:multiple sugar transport system substrate-binding protein